MDCKSPYIKIFLWLFLFFQKVDLKFTTQEKHENITFLGITFLSDHLQKWQTPFWNRLNELHLIISFVCHKQLVLYHKKILLALVRSRFCAFQQFVYFCHSATPGIIILSRWAISPTPHTSDPTSQVPTKKYHFYLRSFS